MTMTLRALLVDDEPPALQRLQQLLQEHGGVDVVGLVGSVEDACTWLKRNPVDLVFLDLRLPGADGSALVPQLGASVAVIFTTAHSDYAVSAFEAGVHDYLLKPIQRSRLSLSLERLRQRHERLGQSSSEQPNGFWIEANEGEKATRQFVEFADVLWVAGMQNYTHLQMSRGEGAMLKRTMKYWEEVLPSELFLRLDRSTIIQYRLVERWERQSRSCTLLRFGRTADAPTLAIGSTASTRLQQALTPTPVWREP